MNATLLLQVKEKILQDPAHFNMGIWQSHCGTTCCIAGWACALNDKFSHPFGRTAADLLGISEAEGDSLFYVTRWPIDLLNKFSAASKTYGGCSLEAAQVAAERIDRFLAEKCPNFKKELGENERNFAA